MGLFVLTHLTFYIVKAKQNLKVRTTWKCVYDMYNDIPIKPSVITKDSTCFNAGVNFHTLH